MIRYIRLLAVSCSAESEKEAASVALPTPTPMQLLSTPTQPPGFFPDKPLPELVDFRAINSG